MKKYVSISFLFILALTFTACTNSSNTTPDTPDKTEKEELVVVTLNNKMLIFEARMNKYVSNRIKNNKELEKLHLDFVPILKWEAFKGNNEYNTAALSVGSIVHKLGDLEGDEYEILLKTLIPSYEKFYTEYGN